MSPQTNFIDTTPVRITGRGSPRTWDAPAVFAAPERKKRRADRTSLCVQITLCIVVAALLFSVIAVPKLRASSAKIEADRAAQDAAGGR